MNIFQQETEAWAQRKLQIDRLPPINMGASLSLQLDPSYYLCPVHNFWIKLTAIAILDIMAAGTYYWMKISATYWLKSELEKNMIGCPFDNLKNLCKSCIEWKFRVTETISCKYLNISRYMHLMLIYSNVLRFK